MTDNTHNVYAAISAASKQIAQTGIVKNRKNQQQGFMFRGIDDVLNTLSSVLTDNGLVILPSVKSRECVERTTKSGGALFTVTVSVDFTLISTSDGSSHTVTVYGEAMDSADKATNKAMSAAYKYMALQVFCIPTEGDNDADSTTHDVATLDTNLVSLKLATCTNQEEITAIYRMIGSPRNPEIIAMFTARKNQLAGER